MLQHRSVSAVFDRHTDVKDILLFPLFCCVESDTPDETQTDSATVYPFKTPAYTPEFQCKSDLIILKVYVQHVAVLMSSSVKETKLTLTLN